MRVICAHDDDPRVHHQMKTIPWCEELNPTSYLSTCSLTQLLRLGRADPPSTSCKTTHDASRFPALTRHGALEWTNTYRTTVRATRPGSYCVSSPSDLSVPYQRYSTTHKTAIRPALTLQATIYPIHIPRRTPVSCLRDVSRRHRRRGAKRGMRCSCLETLSLL